MKLAKLFRKIIRPAFIVTTVLDKRLVVHEATTWAEAMEWVNAYPDHVIDAAVRVWQRPLIFGNPKQVAVRYQVGVIATI
ncbi:hypothetical protein SMA75_20325 [Escherichia coli]|uniref:hypothetical protein n=1 Tax=Escherichia coli TaxID=562 RepID=UPI0030796813